MTRLSIALNIRASKQRVWALITHPEQYPSFISDVKSVTIMQRDSTAALVHWKTTVQGIEIQWTEQCHYDHENSIVTFQSTKGDFTLYRGTLAVSHCTKGVQLSFDATLDWGLPSFERIISKVVEEKARRTFFGMLVAIKRHIESKQPKRTFGFVIHPLDLGLISIAFREPNIVFKRKDLLSKAFEWLPPFKCSDIVGLKSLDGTEVDGALIYCPLLPEQMISNQGEFALKRIIEAVKVAEALNARIVGLGAYAANIGRKGLLISEAVEIPVTTGTSYTIAIAIQGLERACEAVEARLGNLNVGIVGATGTIGITCAELLANRVGSLILCSRNESRLNNAVGLLQEKFPGLRVKQTTQLDWLIANSDVILTATSSPDFLINACSLRPGTIVCDVSRPRNVSPESVDQAGNSVLVFDGGVVRPPGEVDFDFYFGLPSGLAYACMAETMILALAQRFEGYSIGGNLTTSKVDEISRLGHEFGFRLAELRWCEREVPDITIENVRNCIHQRVIKTWV